MILNPVEKLEYIIINEKVLGTVNLDQIYNASIIYYLNNILIPEIKNFFKSPFKCLYCGFKFEIIIDAFCPSCTKPFNIIDEYRLIEKDYNSIRNLITKNSELKLNQIATDLMLYSELQLKPSSSR